MRAEPRIAAIPLRASSLTRTVYASALVGLLVSAIVGSSGWISLALGGGAAGRFGRTAFAIVASLMLFRAYQVLRYPAALEARRPNALGWGLRWLGLLGMLVGAVSAAGLFLVKPITLLLFKRAGEAAIGYFVVGLWLVMLSNCGWLGCLAFEVSRACGKALPDGTQSSWGHRKQDLAILGVLVTTVISAPQLLRTLVGPPCGERNLAACVSTTQGGVRRVIALPQGEPVTLETNVDEIEMRSTSGRKWSLLETPWSSLRGAGHPAAESAPSNVHVRLAARPVGDTVVLDLSVAQGVEETAHFGTRFASGAVLEKTTDGGTRLAIDLPANAQPSMRPSSNDDKTGKSTAYDQLFIQLRGALGSESEAREWPMRTQRPAVLLKSSMGLPISGLQPDGPVDPACNGKLEVKVAKEPAFQGSMGWPMRAITFLQATGPGPHTLMGPADRVVCRAGEIWIFAYPDRRPDLRIRRYGADGKLARFVDTIVPPASLGDREFDLVDGQSLREENGRIRFERVVSSLASGNPVEKTRDLFEVVL